MDGWDPRPAIALKMSSAIDSDLRFIRFIVAMMDWK